MSGDTYSIYVKVDSTQAKTAAKDLENLGEASVTAEVSLKNLGKESTTTTTKIADATKAVKHLANEYRNAAGVIDTAGLGAKLGMGGKQVVSPDIAKELNRIANQASITDTALGKLGDAAKYVRSTFVLFVGIEIARFLRDTAGATKEAADAYTNMKSKLDIATYSQQELNKSFEDSFNIANKYYTSVTDVASAYAKFNPIVASLGRNTADTAKIVESLSASLLISGNNTVDAAETFRQFAQAISGPKVQMEEMNTIIDSNQALWRGLQREFPDIIAKYGSLKEAISKQAISNEMLINATIKLGDEFEALATRKVPTIENAMAVLGNSFIQYVGEADDATGASSILANVILDLAESLRSVEGKGEGLAVIINTIAQAMAGTRGAVADYIDLMAGLANAFSGFSMAQNQMDPEVAKLMKLGAGQVPIADLAAKPNVKPTTQPQLTPRGTGVDSKKASKEAKDALDAFKATIAAQISAAENAEKLYDAMSNNSKKRYDIERERVQGLAELKIRATKSETMRLAITEEAQTKILDSINQETNLRQAAVDKEMETLAVKLAGVQQEIDAADAHKLKQAERIELATKLSDVETEMAVKRSERTQIELDAIGQIQDAEQSLAEARQQASETLVKEEALRQLEIMSSNLEYAKEMATGLAEAFGDVGTAIGGMTVALAEYDKQSATIEIARKEAVDKAEGDQKRITEINDDAAKKQAKAQIKSYGDMTQAAQGFFKKGSKGYEAMGAAVKVFRAFEMAQSAMSMVKQMGDMGSMLAQFIGMETTKTTTKIASNTAQQASDATGAVTSATKAVADAGQGDPYTGIIRAAAMLAFMAAIGIAVGGGGGGASAPAIPDRTGMGTVKGDPNAVSESISKSLDILTENSSNDLNYSADMLEALLAIKDAIGGISDQVATGLTPAITNLTTKFGAEGVKQAGFLFRSQDFNKVYESGLLKGYIGARIETESSQMMVTVKKGQTLVTEYGKQFQTAFGSVIRAVADSIGAAAESIGLSQETIIKRLQDFKINLGTIDIAGLSAEEAAKKIESAISAMSDTMAEKALPEFLKFQQVGEGYKQTITRVAEGINRATGELERLGFEAINYTEIEKTRGDVAAEIARQTLIAQSDLGDGAKRYVEQLTGGLSDIIDGYKQLVKLRDLLSAGGFDGNTLDRTLINAAGGMNEFQSALEEFNDRFLTDQEKIDAEYTRLNKVFSDLGFSMPQTNADFQKLLKSFDLSTESGKKLFGQIIGLSGSFADLTDAMKEQEQAAKDAAQAQIDAIKQTQEKLVNELQANVDKAFTAMQKSYADLQKVQERFLNYAKNIRAYLDEITGAKSAYISPEERYRIAKAEFGRVSALASAGNEEALASIVSAGKDFLDASRDYNASNTAFQDDFVQVTKSLESSAKSAESQALSAENQLRIAEGSYSALIQINNSTLGVQSAVAALSSSMASYAAAVNALAAGQANAAAATPVATSNPNIYTTTGGGLITTAPVTTGQIYTALGGTGRLRPGGGSATAFATGGEMPAGLSLVGEYGPELISSGGGYVTSAGATANFFATIKDAITITSAQQTALLKDQVAELQALVRLQSAANRELINQLAEINAETSESTRLARIEASA